MWVWSQPGLGLKWVRGLKPPRAQTQVWGGHDARGSRTACSLGEERGEQRGLRRAVPIHALLLCRETFPRTPCFPAGTRSPSMPWSFAGTGPRPPPCSPALPLRAGGLSPPCRSAPSLSPCCLPCRFLTQPCQKQAGKAQVFRTSCATISPRFPVWF